MASKRKSSTKKPAISLDDMIVGLADAQRLVGKGETHILMLVRTGLLKKIGPGRYRVADVAKAALKYRESEDRQSSQTAESKRVATARAREIELRTARMARDVIPMQEVIEFLEETLGAFRSELESVPAAATRDVALRASIALPLNEAIGRLRKKFDAGASSLRSRRPLTDEEDDDAAEV